MSADLPSWLLWVSALSPVATLVLAASAAVVAWRTLGQRSEADARTHWWDRTRWAIERAQDTDTAARIVGIAVLRIQAESDLVRTEEARIIEAVWTPIVGQQRRDAAEALEPGVEYRVREPGSAEVDDVVQ